MRSSARVSRKMSTIEKIEYISDRVSLRKQLGQDSCKKCDRAIHVILRLDRALVITAIKKKKKKKIELEILRRLKKKKVYYSLKKANIAKVSFNP